MKNRFDITGGKIFIDLRIGIWATIEQLITNIGKYGDVIIHHREHRVHRAINFTLFSVLSACRAITLATAGVLCGLAIVDHKIRHRIYKIMP